MRFPPPLVLLAVFVMLGAAPAFAEKAGTVSSLAALFAEDGALPRQNASVPISVHNGATFAAYGPSLAFAPNTFGTIYGPVGASSPGGSGSLVAETKVWNDSFVNGVAPTNLGGVRVRINGKDAFIVFTGLGATFGINYDQVNFISPDDNALGPVSVQVLKNGTTVAQTTVNLGGLSPAFFAFGPSGSTQFLAAVQATRAELVATPDYFGTGPIVIAGVTFTVRPAAPGDIISLYGTGFGPTNPPIPAGQQLGAQLAPLTNQATIRIGGMPADVLYSGLAPNFTGSYQFNVRVPNVTNGNHTVSVDIGGLSINSHVPLPVQAP